MFDNIKWQMKYAINICFGEEWNPPRPDRSDTAGLLSSPLIHNSHTASIKMKTTHTHLNKPKYRNDLKDLINILLITLM